MTIKACPVCSVSWYADKPEKHMMTCTAKDFVPYPGPKYETVTYGVGYNEDVDGNREPTEMELRVAKAIRACDENPKTGPLATYEELARAAIRAMRVPTTEMMSGYNSFLTQIENWQAMIDAASPGDE